MSTEQEITLQPPPGVVGKSTLIATRSRVDADGVELRASWLHDGELLASSSHCYRLTANHWERLEIPLPGPWRGEDLCLEVACPFGMIEVVGARIISSVMRETLWEKLGRNLTAGVRPSAGLLVLSNQFRLRLLCTGNDARLSLPDLKLPESENPRVLELGLRVRTDLAAIGHTLQEWVEDAEAKRQETLEKLTAAEASRVAGEKLATTLLAEIDMARAHGDERVAALTTARAQTDEHVAALTEAHARAEERAAALTEARARAEERAAALTETHARAEERAATLSAEIVRLRDSQQQERRIFESTLAVHRQTLAKLHAELTETRRESEDQLGRVRSMQRSLSWRMTLPWRVIGRALTGRRPTGRRES